MALPSFEPTPRAVLFDLDDTLCDYSAAREARLRIAFSLDANGLPSSDGKRDLDAMVADSIRTHPHGADHFPALFLRHGIGDNAIAGAASDWYRRNRFHGLRLFQEAEMVLRSVRAGAAASAPCTRRPVAIITNGPAEVQRAKIELLGIGHLVDFVLISEEFGAAKPNPAIFGAALHLANVEASDAVFIGDSPEFDIVGAASCGIRSVWINRRGDKWNQPGQRPDREVAHVKDVPSLVGSST